MKVKSLILVCLVLTFVCSAWVQANDSAVEIAAGGLKLRKEHRVSIEKENLFISPDLVAVECEFLNRAKLPVISEVAFPIPPFRFDCVGPTDDGRELANFRVWVDGKPIKVKKEVRAFAANREVTADLRWAGIDIEQFGNPDCEGYVTNNDMARLGPNVRRRLIKVGAVKPWGKDDGVSGVAPEWEAHVTYHWRQKFLPGIPVRIRHEYKPVVGFQQVPAQELMDRYTAACFGEEVRKRLTVKAEQDLKDNVGYLPTIWVDYILTTANTWKTPIKDFQLVVGGRSQDTVAFCWDGTAEGADDEEFRVHETDFVPKKELRVYFLGGIRE